MKPVLPLGPLAVAALLSWGSSARAEQFIVTDVSYTHSADTTTDSHYRVSPLASAPKNWVSPVDYSTGSVHVLLEVKTKPGTTPTKFQICFEGTPDYACTDQSPTYTTPDTYQWTTKFSDFYYGGDVDWSKGVSKVALILKDTMNNKPQGDPKYVPTDLHVVVTVISAGASFVPPAPDAGVKQDAGATDAGAPRADAGEGGTARPAGDAGRDRDAGSEGSDGSVSVRRDAGIASGDEDASSPSSDAGTGSASGGSSGGASNGKDAGGGEDENDDGGDDGCSVGPGARSRAGGAWLLLGMFALAVRRRARSRS